MDNNETLLTVKDCAKMLHISIPTFWRRVADGAVPQAIKIGSLSRWTHSDIKAVIEKASQSRDTQAA